MESNASDYVMSVEEVNFFNEYGFFVVGYAMPEDTCDALRLEADKILDDLGDIKDATIFTTYDQSKSSDEYFLNSGGKIRYFWEDKAFTEDGELRKDRKLSINKIGHG